MVVGARQSFQCFRQKTWFLGNNRDLPQFRYQTLHNLISTTKWVRLNYASTHHDPPPSKIYPPPPTTSQNISTTIYHFRKNGPPPHKSQISSTFTTYYDISDFRKFMFHEFKVTRFILFVFINKIVMLT